MELKYIQNRMRELYLQRDKERGVFATFVWLTEEIGEFAKALLSGDRENMEEEIADIIAWTLSLANLLEIDAEASICRKYSC